MGALLTVNSIGLYCERGAHLARLLADRSPHIHISPALDAPDWDTLARLGSEARAHRVEGLMLKRLSSPYHMGRRRGDWWKWKIDPYSIDAVPRYSPTIPLRFARVTNS